MVQNNPAGLNRAEIEHAVGNQYNRLLRQQQGSKTLSPLKCITTARRRPGDPSIHSRVTALIAVRKVVALGNAGARRRVKNLQMPPPTRRAEVMASARSDGVMSTLRLSTMACTRDLSTGFVNARNEELRRVRCW